jgi:FAD/FMN-containing dehydrogenase
MANLGMLLWAIEDAREPLRAVRGYLEQLPAGMGALVAGLSVPPAPGIPEQHHGRTALGVLVASWGSREAHAAAIAPLRDLHPLAELVTPIPYVVLQQLLDETCHWGVHAYEKGLNLDALPDAAIDVLAEHSLRMPRGASQSLIIPWGGEVARAAKAWPLARREAAWVVHPFMLWDDPARDAEHIAWGRGVSAALAPYVSGGVYLNFVGHEGDERIRAAYGDANLRRLQAVKQQYDPENVFRLNHNIRPVRAAALPV